MENNNTYALTANNKLVGVWSLETAFLYSEGIKIPILGDNPKGTLVLTEGLNFSVIVHNPAIEPFASGDRLNGTDKEYRDSIHNSLALYGTYRVDEQGDFWDQQIEGSTFPNWNGISRGRDVLQLKVEGDQILENMIIPQGGSVQIEWRRKE